MNTHAPIPLEQAQAFALELTQEVAECFGHEVSMNPDGSLELPECECGVSLLAFFSLQMAKCGYSIKARPLKLRQCH